MGYWIISAYNFAQNHLIININLYILDPCLFKRD